MSSRDSLHEMRPKMPQTKKSNMEIGVSFLAGTSIEDACTEARRFAITNNLAYVKFDFNGISCSISQRCSVEKAIEKFLEALKIESKNKFVIE